MTDSRETIKASAQNLLALLKKHGDFDKALTATEIGMIWDDVAHRTGFGAVTAFLESITCLPSARPIQAPEEQE